jgi:trans-2-enoyl-CoA reductase
MIRVAKDLSSEQRAVIESIILGRSVQENEAISVRAIEPPAFSDELREEVLEGLKAYFAKMDERRQSVSPREADAAIDEALRSTRPNYRPVR